MGKTEVILFGPKRKLNKYNDFSIVLSDGQTIRAKQSVIYLGLELNQYLDGEQIVLNIVKKVNSRLKFLYRQANYFNQNVKKMICIMLLDYNVPRTKSLGLSLTRILIILTMRISNLWAFWTSTQELSSSAWIMLLIFFTIPVLTTWRKTFLGCQTYIVIIQGEVISISTFQELKHTVLGHFLIMPLLIGIGCLMISSQSLWNLFLKEVLKLTF